eukprot:1363178-Ditylum_brightwellii.AAC.1
MTSRQNSSIKSRPSKKFSGLNKKIDKEDKIVLVLEKVPKDYAGFLAITEQEKGSRPTMKDLENAMKTNFCT